MRDMFCLWLGIILLFRNFPCQAHQGFIVFISSLIIFTCLCRECSSKLSNPRGVTDCLLSSTGQHCFTFNKEEECFVQWSLDPLVLEDSLQEHEASARDYLQAIPVNKQERLYTDMKNVFCYVQIERGASSLSKTVPIEDIPTMCRALGFYPTEREIEDMLNEVSYDQKQEVLIIFY